MREWCASLWSPSADLYETKDGFVLYFDLPGVRREDVELLVEQKSIVLRGYRNPPEEGCSPQRLELRTGRFERDLELPAMIDVASVSASLSEGVLRLCMKRREAGSVMIRVQSEEEGRFGPSRPSEISDDA